MIDEARSQIRQRNCVLVDGLCRLALVAVAIAVWLAASIAQGGSIAVAAEVNAIGIPAPVGFADIVERVKPAVVGVQVKIEGVTTSEEPQQEAPPSHRSPLDRFFRHFGTPMPDGSCTVPRTSAVSNCPYNEVASNRKLASTTNDTRMTRNLIDLTSPPRLLWSQPNVSAD